MCAVHIAIIGTILSMHLAPSLTLHGMCCTSRMIPHSSQMRLDTLSAHVTMRCIGMEICFPFLTSPGSFPCQYGLGSKVNVK